jgi:hypothetical protein
LLRRNSGGRSRAFGVKSITCLLWTRWVTQARCPHAHGALAWIVQYDNVGQLEDATKKPLANRDY